MKQEAERRMEKQRKKTKRNVQSDERRERWGVRGEKLKSDRS